MARPFESAITISCLQCDWSVEAANTASELTDAFAAAAQTHASAGTSSTPAKIGQRLRAYSENYSEEASLPDTCAARSDGPIIEQTAFPDTDER